MSTNGKTGWKVALLKVAGTIVVVMLGLAGAGLGYLAQVKSGSTDEALKATVDQLNNRTIPMLETLLKEQREELRESRERTADLRERLAYVEALLTDVAKRTRTKLPKVDKTPTIKTGMVKVMSANPITGDLEEPDLIPRLEVQQIAQPE